MIHDLPPIRSVACGPSHMLAIAEDSEITENRDGSTYAWGRNNRGQLGISNKIDQYSPQKLYNLKEKFVKVSCGQNFSIGITKNSQIYFWGNYKFMCSSDNKDFKDYEEPIPFREMNTMSVKDVSVNYKNCLAINDKGEILEWGK